VTVLKKKSALLGLLTNHIIIIAPFLTEENPASRHWRAVSNGGNGRDLLVQTTNLKKQFWE